MEALSRCVSADTHHISRKTTEKEISRNALQFWDTLNLEINPCNAVFTHRLSRDFPMMCGPSSNGEEMIKFQMPGAAFWEERLWTDEKAKEGTYQNWEILDMDQVLSCLEEVSQLPSIEDFTLILKKCRKEVNLDYTSRMYEYIRRNDLGAHKILGNEMVAMLVEVGSICDARQVFNNLKHKNECAWNALITGYVKYGEPEQALTLYQDMCQDASIQPSRLAFMFLLRACAKLKNLEIGQKICTDIIENGFFQKDALLGNSMVDMYAKCYSLTKAREVFDHLPNKNVVSWTTLIAGYVDYGLGEEALNCFEQMKCEGIDPNAITFLCVLKACGVTKASEKGQEVHNEILKCGLGKDLVVGSSLVDMYAKCGLLSKSQEVLEQLQSRNVVSWNALIAGYAEHGLGEKAMLCLKKMQHEGLSPDTTTFVCTLKACISIGATEKGQELHVQIAKTGLEGDLMVGSTLVDLYAKCGLLTEAHEVFDRIPAKNVVSWTALISGYAEYGQGKEALRLFEQMQQEGISPNVVTFACSLKACSSIGAACEGQELHAKAIREGLESHLLVGSGLVDMYAKCGLLGKAQEVFDQLPSQNVVSWTALIAGYTDLGHAEEALSRFKQMQEEGVLPTAATYICCVKACGNLGARDRASTLHVEISEKGFEKHPLVGSTLVDMYAKCGSMVKAQEVFDKLSGHNVITWNVLLAGYAQVGQNEDIFDSFGRMLGRGVSPNLITFVSVLNACSHAGLVQKGQIFFEVMSKFGIIPTFEHQSCMVDLLGRAGQLDKALALTRELPCHPNLLVVWHTLLGACRKWGNVELGKQAFQHALGLDDKDASVYVFMSNMHGRL